MNARGNISARSRKRHVADLDAPTRDADPAHALSSDLVVRSPGANSENTRNYGPRIFVI
jgi:hypothetical protein